MNTGSDVVQFIIGTGTYLQTFKVHKSILCEVAPFFVEVFDESQASTATLSEDDPQTFGLFIYWLYHRVIIVLPIQHPFHARYALGEMIKLFGFAEKYRVDYLCDHLMDSIVDVYKDFGAHASVELIALGYEHTGMGSRLRNYLARTYTFRILHGSEKGPWTTERMDELVKKIPDLQSDFLAFLGRRSHAGGLQIGCPNEKSRCTYHQHNRNTACPYMYERIEEIFEDDEIPIGDGVSRYVAARWLRRKINHTSLMVRSRLRPRLLLYKMPEYF